VLDLLNRVHKGGLSIILSSEISTAATRDGVQTLPPSVRSSGRKMFLNDLSNSAEPFVDKAKENL
jgi:hypothetical protein